LRCRARIVLGSAIDAKLTAGHAWTS
jgi:hypothetical protein